MGVAAEVARAVRKAESVGNRTCGFYYIESYCKQLKTGRVYDRLAQVAKAVACDGGARMSGHN